MAPKILFSPKQPDNIMQIVRELAPPGFDLVGSIPARRSSSRPPRTPSTTWAWPGRWAASSSARRPKMKLVQLLSAGYDRVDIEAARKAKVPVANNGGANAIAVAEHTLTLILAVLKRIVKFHNDIVAGKWRVGGPTDMPVYELSGRTVGIIGLGNIGKKVARRALAFDAKVLYYDIARLPEHQEDALGVRFVALHRAAARRRTCVSLHVPLDDSTREHDRRAASSALMKRTAIIVNTCRGPVIDEDALYTALKDGRIAGAGPRRDGRGAAQARPPALLAAQRHPHAALGGADRGRTGRRASATASTTSSAWRPAAQPLWVVPELNDLLK